MVNANERSNDSGPAWWWVTAWSLQGTLAWFVLRQEFASEFVRLAVLGAAAALPLLVLYVAVRRRAACG